MANWKESAKKSLENRKESTSTSTIKSSNIKNTPTTGTKSSGSWQEAAKKSLNSRGYIAPENRLYELKLDNGLNFGTVSYGAYNALKNNALDKYTPKNIEEKIAIDDFNSYVDKKAKEQEAVEKQKRINSNPVFKRYNIDPEDFTYDDFRKWAEEHGFEYRMGGNDFTGAEMKWLPKPKGGWKFWEVVPSKEEQADKKTLEQLAENNARKDSSQKDGGTVRAALIGVIDGLTFGATTAYADWDAKRDYKKAGLNPDDFVSYKQAGAKTLDEHKIANTIGNVAGSVISLGGLSKAVGAATSSVKWIAKAPSWVKSAINSGITFAIQSGAQTAFDGGNFEDVLKSAGINLVGGAVGGGVGSKVGSIGEKLLFDKGLQHKVIPEMIRTGVSSATFAGSKTASTYFLYPEDYRPTKEEMAKDITTAFAFGAISSGINTIKTSAQNKKYLDDLYQKMAADYESMAKANISAKNDTAGIQKFAKNVVGYSNVMEAYLTGKEYSATIDGKTYTFTPNKIRLVGQDKYVKSILGEIDTIRNNANAVLNGMGTPTTDIATISAPVNNANAPAVAVALSERATSAESAPASSVPTAAVKNTVAPIQTNSQEVTSVAATEAVTPNSTPTVSADVPSTDIKTNATGELGEIMDSEPITAFTPEAASSDIKRLENILIAQGADDVSRQEIVATALKIEKALAGSDRTIRSVFNDVSKITSSAVAEIKNKAGISGAYWKLFGENFKALSSGNVSKNTAFVAEYSNAYAEALKKNNAEKYNTVMISTDGTDLTSELPQTIIQNVIPANVQNAGEYRLVAAQIENLVRDVGLRISNERAEIYGAETNEGVPVAENTEVATAQTVDVSNVGPAEQPVTNTNEQNMPVEDENVPVNDTVTNNDIIAESEISAIVDVVNDTLYPKAKVDILNIAKKNSVKNGIEFFAENLKAYYKKNGTIEKFSGYFIDDGDKVAAIIKGISSETSVNNTEHNENTVSYQDNNIVNTEMHKDVAETEYAHLYNEKKVSKDYLKSVNEEIENAIISIRNGDLDSVPSVIDVTELNENTIKAISDFVGFDISGYMCKIERDRLVHIENRHGINGEHDQSLSDPKDTARMGYVVNNSDSIEWVVDDKGNKVFDSQYNNKNNKPSPIIMLNSKIDGTYCISQAVPDSKKKTLWITSARIQKAAVGSQVPYDSNATPQLQTSKTPLVSSSAFDNIITQDNNIVNNSVRSSDKNNTKKLTDKCELIVTKHTKTGKYTLSRESEGHVSEQTRNDLLHGNSKRGYNASTRKQAERVSEYQQKLKGKTKAERQGFAKELLSKGLTEEKIEGEHKYNLVKPEGYNDDMLSVVEEAKRMGKDVGFFIGHGLRKFDGQRDFLIDGIMVSDSKILLRYDGFYSPQTLLRHENVHVEWDNPEMQEAKDIILNDISDAEKNKILSDGRYKDYLTLYKGDVDKVLEEFIADVFAGMNDYALDYIDTVIDYWYEGKVVDRYNPAEYTNSIDAGSTNADVIDSIGFGNDYRLSESGDVNGGENSKALAEDGTYGGKDSIWKRSDDSKEVYRRLENDGKRPSTGLENRRGYVDWGRRLQSNGTDSPREKKRAYGILREISKRRIADVDAEGRKLSPGIKEYFSNTIFKNEKGELIPLFHSTDDEFNTFEYGDFGFHLGTAEQAMYIGKQFIKEVYANITNPLYISKDRMRWPSLVVANEALSQGIITTKEYTTISKLDGFHGWDYNSTANKSLRNLLKVKGYDGIIYNNGIEGDGISAIAFDSNQIKYVSNTKPTTSPDIRYALNSYETDSESLTPERKKQIFEQFDKDRVGVDKPTQKQLWGERAAWVAHNMSRVFPNIPEQGEKGTFFAEFRKSMIQWKNLPTTASFMVQDKLNKMTEGLTPKEFKTFSELVYFLDLQEEAQIQKERGYAEILLPNEITPNEVDAIVKALNEEATENVQQALIKRQNIWESLKSQYIELNRYIGFDTDGKFKRKNYYHHQVIDYMNNGNKGTGSREIGIKAGRGWLKERQGSTHAINTDFLAVEYKAMLQMQYDVYIAETLGRIKKQYDIKPQLEEEAFKNNKKALNEIIQKEATDKDGNMMFDSNGKPNSETYRKQMWYNSRIMFGFGGLFDLAERNELPTYNGEYARVVEALKRHSLTVPGLYKYVGVIAGTNLPDNATDAQEQAVLNARTVLKYTSQKKAWIREKLDDDYQTWETIAKSMSDTHTIHQPRRGNYFYTKTVIDEEAFNKAHNEMVLSLASGEVDLGDVDLNKLFTQYADTVRLTGAAYEQWVLPNEIVTTMDEIANPKQATEGAKVARGIVSAWKGWATSVNPLRTVKFGLRNLVGDLDAVIAGNPKVTMYSKKAVKDIYQAMRHKNYSSEFMEWVERGGYTSMIFANEMDSKMQDELFSHLKEKQGVNIFKIPVNMFEKYYNGVENVHNFREAILRYSAYLYFKEAIKRNGGAVKDYVASNKYIVRGLNTVEDKAYQLSKDLLGAYDEVGKFGQTLRRYWIPFYSFTETNLKRYYRLFENIITSDDKIPKKAGKLLLKVLMVNMLGLLMGAWNKLVMKEYDDKLPPSVRNIPHLTLGKFHDDIYAFRQLGSFSELLEWFGLDDYKWSSEDLTAPLDKAWGMVTPFLKMPIELVSGLNFYPSLTQPRAIRDKWQHFFNSFGVNAIYNEVTGKPTKGMGEILKSAFVYSYDYKESAYYEILDIKRRYQGKTDNTIYGIDAKSNALYYMKTAVRYKDKEAALKYLDEYFENGGTVKGIKQSFATLNPMYGFTGKKTAEKGEAFIASLTDDEKEKLKIAQDYYESDLMLPENVLDRLDKKDITDEEAKNVLRSYINAKCK